MNSLILETNSGSHVTPKFNINVNHMAFNCDKSVTFYQNICYNCLNTENIK